MASADTSSSKKKTNLSAPPVADKQAGSASVPATWPGAFGIYKLSAEAVKKNIGAIIILYASSLIISLVLGQVFKQGGDIIAQIISALVVLPLSLIYIAGVRGKKLELEQALKQPLEFYLQMVLLQLLVGLAIIASLLLLVVPFFFVFPRLILANYYLADKKLGAIEAFKASWDNTEGHLGKVYGIVGVSILMALLFITIIGIPVAIYLLIMYSAATTVLYEYVSKRR